MTGKITYLMPTVYPKMPTVQPIQVLSSMTPGQVMGLLYQLQKRWCNIKRKRSQNLHVNWDDKKKNSSWKNFLTGKLTPNVSGLYMYTDFTEPLFTKGLMI